MHLNYNNSHNSRKKVMLFAKFMFAREVQQGLKKVEDFEEVSKKKDDKHDKGSLRCLKKGGPCKSRYATR